MPRFEKARQAFVVWLARRLPPCEDVTPLISASLDRRLTLRERLVLRLHLWVCLWCRRYLRQVLLLREVMHRHAHQHEDADAPAGALSAEARARLQRALSGDEA